MSFLFDMPHLYYVAEEGSRSHLRLSLVTVLDNFVDHAAHLENFDEGWRTFMRQYLSSVQHIVGQQAVVRASKGADTASVPTSFLEELEALRKKVEELSDEVSDQCFMALQETSAHTIFASQRVKLRSELNEQIAETNVLRALPSGRSPELPRKVRQLARSAVPSTDSRDPPAVSQLVAQVGQYRGESPRRPLFASANASPLPRTSRD